MTLFCHIFVCTKKNTTMDDAAYYRLLNLINKIKEHAKEQEERIFLLESHVRSIEITLLQRGILYPFDIPR